MLRRAELRTRAAHRDGEPGLSRLDPRDSRDRDGHPDSEGDGGQPDRNPGEGVAPDPRRFPPAAAGPGAHGAGPADRLDPVDPAGGAGLRTVPGEPGAHEPAVAPVDRAEDALYRRRDG